MSSSKSISTAITVSIVLLVAGPALHAGALQKVDACTLLTPVQVNAVLGVSVGPGQHISSPSKCGWAEPSDRMHRGKHVVLEVFSANGSLTPVDRFNKDKAPARRITKTPVTGVGDDAYFITTPGLGTGLNVRKGSSVFQLRVNGFPPDQIQTIEKVLAKDVLAKL